MDGYSVTIPARIAAGLRRHACATRPVECCGALLGRRAGGRFEVRTLVAVENAEQSATRYRIEARSFLQLERRAAHAGLDVMGFYHSHPVGPATPSNLDLELAWPGFIYVIVQPDTGAVRAWRLLDDRRAFAELPISRGTLAGGVRPPGHVSGADAGGALPPRQGAA